MEADFPVGTAAHQGDLILVRIARLPTIAKPRKNRQLATGNSQGSRHVLIIGSPFDCETTDVRKAIADACSGIDVGDSYIGPVFVTDNGIADLAHPEHGDHHYCGDMTIAVVYQRNLDSEERERRIQD